jgi:hypothetical protein
MNKVLIVVPSRSRPEVSLEFYEEFKKNSVISDLMFGLDDDDVEYPRIPGVLYEVNPRKGMNGTLNEIAVKYADQYDYIGFLGDDHRPRTYGWDEILVNAVKDIKNGITYGRDMTQDGQASPICTFVILDTNIIRKLGYMAPTSLKHLYLDNFWRDIGYSMSTLRYNHDVIVEHMHPAFHKAEWDEQYREVNAPAVYEHDREAYQSYISSGEFQRAVDTLLKND